VFTARYAQSPYIKQIRFVFKGLNTQRRKPEISQTEVSHLDATICNLVNLVFIASLQADFPAVKLVDLSHVRMKTKERQIIFIYEEYINIF
jgi:hypothetical protein